VRCIPRAELKTTTHIGHTKPTGNIKPHIRLLKPSLRWSQHLPTNSKSTAMFPFYHCWLFAVSPINNRKAMRNGWNITTQIHKELLKNLPALWLMLLRGLELTSLGRENMIIWPSFHGQIEFRFKFNMNQSKRYSLLPMLINNRSKETLTIPKPMPCKTTLRQKIPKTESKKANPQPAKTPRKSKQNHNPAKTVVSLKKI
jgi:hypothetical protein